MTKRKKTGWMLLAAGICCLAASIPLILFTTHFMALVLLALSLILNAVGVNFAFLRKSTPLSQPREKD